MAWNIYKSGQGYWTRLLSGLGGGVLVTAGAWWLWYEIQSHNLRYGVYIQAAIAVAVIAAFGLLIYRLTCAKPKTVDFLIATEGEMKKVNWPSRREVFGSTRIVITFLFLLVSILFFSDLFFQWFFRLIKVLDI